MFRFFQNTKRSLDSLLNLIIDLVADGLLFFRVLRKNPLCCAKIPFSFEVDRYNGQPANNRLTFMYALLPEKEPPAIVGLETAVEMNLVRLELCATVVQVDGNCSV
jgi:hypothetical protein